VPTASHPARPNLLWAYPPQKVRASMTSGDHLGTSRWSPPCAELIDAARMAVHRVPIEDGSTTPTLAANLTIAAQRDGGLLPPP
jgi:hypothetical protein